MPSIVTSGAMNAKALGFGGRVEGADVGDTVNYSVRFNSADSPVLSKAFVTPTSVNIYTLSVWLKRSALSTTQRFFGAGTNHSIGFNTSDQLVLTINGTSYTSTDVFRDVSKPYNFVYTQSGTTYTIYVGDPNQSVGYRTVMTGTSVANTAFNTNAVTHQIGAANSASYLDGYLTDVCFVDGVAQLPTAFGRKSADTGAWVHKNPSGITWGTNGFRLQFNTGAAASDLGIDTSGNGNTFTVTNLSVTAGVGNDWVTDTCTNTYATLNPLINPSADTFSEGALKVVTSSSNYGTSVSTMAIPTTGKWYAEATIVATAGFAAVGTCLTTSNFTSTSWIGSFTGVTYRSNGNKQVNTSASAYGATYTTNDIIGIAYDADNLQITFYKNGVSQGVITGVTAGSYYFGMSEWDPASGTQVWNFGQRAFAYTPPTGYLALCTANLPTPANLKGSRGFAAVTDTGTNVQTTLATARTGWTDYIEWFHDRSASQANRMRFSDDSSNMLDTVTTAAKTAFTALTGGDNYVGYAWRIGTQYGCLSAAVSHTNGVATTVTHNCGVARNAIVLKRTDSTSSWFFWHPDMTAGKLMYLDQNVAEAADTSITSIGTNSFQISSAMATGTYRYIVWFDKDSVCRLSKHTGNASADGSFLWEGKHGVLGMTKNKDGANSFMLFDTVRNTYNVMNSAIDFGNDYTTTEATLTALDQLSGGRKFRTTDANLNTSNVYVNISWGGTDFKFSNAR